MGITIDNKFKTKFILKNLFFTLLFISLISCQKDLFIENGTVKCKDDVPINYTQEINGITYKVVDKIMLLRMINNNEDLRFVCTSKIKNMNRLFFDSEFDFDISNWDVSNVTEMSQMFTNSEFNNDISNWDVANVVDMSQMFRDSKFNSDISNWNVSNVTDMSLMFVNSKFDGDISKWNVGNVTNMSDMFNRSDFNGDISKWDVSNVKDMNGMFFGKERFDGDISNWDVSSVNDMSQMFTYTSFTGNISNWKIRFLTNLNSMLSFNNFNGDLSKWDVKDINLVKYDEFDESKKIYSDVFNFETPMDSTYFQIRKLNNQKFELLVFKDQSLKKYSIKNIEYDRFGICYDFDQYYIHKSNINGETNDKGQIWGFNLLKDPNKTNVKFQDFFTNYWDYNTIQGYYY